MKKSIDILGLPIFSLIDGAEIGTVKQLIIKPDTGNVQLFLVENEQNSIGVYALPYSSAIGVGDFAVTVESGAAIQEISHVENARDLILLGYQVIGTRVLSRKGQLLGSVDEFYVDEETGVITACSFLEQGSTDSVKYFHKPNIMTFGRDVIVIHDEAQIVASLNEPKTASLTLVSDSVAETAASAETSEPPASASGYLIGKVLSDDLLSETGELIAAQGTVITEELVEMVKAIGPMLFMKLNRLAVPIS
ncbi:hypothetical protein CIG75_16190 [Tumebacillus algifaecis]|uniref:PRC-barrel domain-containing protein n=1 Tax=Tumebacillus algifaecis TaxID=1214604 RepID=A0A223D484_9BACL|nr:hypothetical protein [Tumebacillus algifaecis]ASS76335.1 hypothetical protein CIG75_16190 [Tumebacillus algifaecis]